MSPLQPFASAMSALQIHASIMTCKTQGGKLARLTAPHLLRAAASLNHAAESTVALEKSWIITAHLVGINLFRKSLAGIKARRTEL